MHIAYRQQNFFAFLFTNFFSHFASTRKKERNQSKRTLCVFHLIKLMSATLKKGMKAF